MTNEERAKFITDGFFIGGSGDDLEQPNLTKDDLFRAIKGHLDEATEDLRLDLDHARSYQGIEGYGCPLCLYDNGKFLQYCSMHEKIHKLDDESLQAFQDEVVAWQRETFPESTKDTILAHLAREVKELRDSKDPEEAADVLLLLIAFCGKANITLIKEAKRKFGIAKTRKWGEPDAEGVREHIRDEKPSCCEMDKEPEVDGGNNIAGGCNYA